MLELIMDKLTLLDIGKLMATACAGTFSGAALYVNAVEIPASKTVVNTPALLKHWRESFLRASKMQATLAFLSCASAGAVYYFSDSENRWLWLLSSGLIATVFPYTKFVMMGDINKLFEDNVLEEKGEYWVKEKISLWDKRHMYRTAVSDLVFNIMLVSLVLTR